MQRRRRRLGYLDTLAHAPAIAKELDEARERLDEWTAAPRYRALVGLTLADPADIALQWQLLKQRRELATSGTFPAL